MVTLYHFIARRFDHICRIGCILCRELNTAGFDFVATYGDAYPNRMSRLLDLFC